MKKKDTQAMEKKDPRDMKKKTFIILGAVLLAAGAVAATALLIFSADYSKRGYSDSRYETFSRDTFYRSSLVKRDGEWALNNTQLTGDSLVTITAEAFERTEDGIFIRLRVKSRCTAFRGVYFTVENYEKITLNLSSATENRIPLWYMNTDVETPGNWTVEGKFVFAQEELDAAPLPSVEIWGNMCVSLWKQNMMFR